MNWWRVSSRPMRVRHRNPPAASELRQDAGVTPAGAPEDDSHTTMSQLTLPITEVLVVANCWQAEPDAEAVIQRAIAAAAEAVDADVGEAELAIMLTDDSGIRTL